jgi:hypothetical protein
MREEKAGPQEHRRDDEMVQSFSHAILDDPAASEFSPRIINSHLRIGSATAGPRIATILALAAIHATPAPMTSPLAQTIGARARTFQG